MAATGKPLNTGVQIPNVNTTVYTASKVRARIDKVTVCNTTAGAQTFSMYKVPSGGAAGVTNQVIDTKSVGVDETYVCHEMSSKWLADGDTIVAIASAGSALTLQIDGYEFT